MAFPQPTRIASSTTATLGARQVYRLTYGQPRYLETLVLLGRLLTFVAVIGASFLTDVTPYLPHHMPEPPPAPTVVCMEWTGCVHGARSHGPFSPCTCERGWMGECCAAPAPRARPKHRAVALVSVLRLLVLALGSYVCLRAVGPALASRSRWAPPAGAAISLQVPIAGDLRFQWAGDGRYGAHGGSLDRWRLWSEQLGAIKHIAEGAPVTADVDGGPAWWSVVRAGLAAEFASRRLGLRVPLGEEEGAEGGGIVAQQFSLESIEVRVSALGREDRLCELRRAMGEVDALEAADEGGVDGATARTLRRLVACGRYDVRAAAVAVARCGGDYARCLDELPPTSVRIPVVSVLLELRRPPRAAPCAAPAVAGAAGCSGALQAALDGVSSDAAEGAGLLGFSVGLEAFSELSGALRLSLGEAHHPNRAPLPRWLAEVPRAIYSSRCRGLLVHLATVVLPTATLLWALWSLYSNFEILHAILSDAWGSLAGLIELVLSHRLLSPLHGWLTQSSELLAHVLERCDELLREATEAFYVSAQVTHGGPTVSTVGSPEAIHRLSARTWAPSQSPSPTRARRACLGGLMSPISGLSSSGRCGRCAHRLCSRSRRRRCSSSPTASRPSPSASPPRRSATAPRSARSGHASRRSPPARAGSARCSRGSAYRRRRRGPSPSRAPRWRSCATRRAGCRRTSWRSSRARWAAPWARSCRCSASCGARPGAGLRAGRRRRWRRRAGTPSSSSRARCARWAAGWARAGGAGGEATRRPGTTSLSPERLCRRASRTPTSTTRLHGYRKSGFRSSGASHVIIDY
eukprot:Transcript_26696.p1 GENE.Transcript_26696~~Transcript_26696.p1  ORF type:complete len:806 (-),score=93.51 Transcript_26696:49-2466(-)